MQKNLKTLFSITFTLILCSCATKVSREDVQRVIQRNPDIIFEVIEKNPEKFLRVAQSAAMNVQKKMANKEKLQELKGIKKFLKNPLSPSISKEDILYGKADSPITIVEYSDFQCPFCKKGYSVMQKLKTKYPQEIKFILKHFPLDFHRMAPTLAKYFESAKIQSRTKALKLRSLFFQHQKQLSQGENFLKTLAKKAGLNIKKLEQVAKSNKVKNKIKRHIKEAKKFNMMGTPSFIVNGIPLRGVYPIEYFEMIINLTRKKN